MQELSDRFHVAYLMGEEFYYSFVAPNFSHVTQNHENCFNIYCNLVVLRSDCFAHPLLYKHHDGCDE